MTLDVRALLASFGTCQQLCDKLHARRLLSVRLKTVQKWRERSTLPVRRLADLMVLATMEGRTLDLYQFLTPAEK